MKIISLDVGEKRIGVARADSSTRIAIPVGFVDVNGSEWQKIARIARLNNTNFFVVGLPRSNEGNETAQTLYVRQFAKTLVEKIPEARIKFQDESLTSVIAEERLKSRKRSYEKGEIDAEAAAIILQDFLESFLAEDMVKSDEESLKPKTTGVVSGVKAKASEVKETATNITKKEADRVKLNTKKAKHKMKTATKLMSGLSALIILALLATGGFFIIREQIRKQRQEEYARQEAEMKADVFNFVIRPGETILDIKANLAKEGYSAEEIEAAFNADYDFAFLKEKPAGSSLEGYLYGETHEFYRDDSVSDIITTFLKGMENVITENNLEEKYAAQGLTLHEGITLASVVQKESQDQEMPTVAQVFLSRLGYGIPLGSDVTVSYAIDQIDPNREIYTDNQSALKIDSCYNTRIYAGLPCGPISNPGHSALLAVAEPSDTAYLYFLTGDDGVMYYSYTEVEHIQNTYLHCQDLCNVSL